VTLNQRYGSSFGVYDRPAFYQWAPALYPRGDADPARIRFIQRHQPLRSIVSCLPITILEATAARVAARALPRSDAMKSATVDLVVTGDEKAAVAAAVEAVGRGQRVLVVLRSDDARVAARLRRLCRAAKSQLTVMTNAEVVCVDGVEGVEAVVVRYMRSGRLRAVNTPVFLKALAAFDTCGAAAVTRSTRRLDGFYAGRGSFTARLEVGFPGQREGRCVPPRSDA
jgi:hypothetical protein